MIDRIAVKEKYSQRQLFCVYFAQITVVELKENQNAILERQRSLC